MDTEINSFIQQNFPDGAPNHTLRGEPQNHSEWGRDFLQSEYWRKFQEAVGRKTFFISDDNFSASIIEHKLPIAGRYFYVPRGPVLSADAERIFNFQFSISKQVLISNDQISKGIQRLINLAKKNKAGWIRIEPANEKILEIIKNAVGVRFIEPEVEGFNELNPYELRKYKIIKAPHDMQPRETLVLDITKSEEQLLAEMKAKTRYNIKLSQKHGVFVKVISNFQFPISNKIPNPNNPNSEFYIKEFIGLVKITAERNKITAHPESYYRKMLEVIPGNIIKLYVAEYENKIIAANLVIFYGKTATYLHGGSNDQYKNLMASYLLQWQAILDAKKAGCERYDLGGISTNYESNTNIRITNKWSGMTRFKTGFSPNTKPVEFPGCWDVVINQGKYQLYLFLQKIKNFKDIFG